MANERTLIERLFEFPWLYGAQGPQTAQPAPQPQKRDMSDPMNALFEFPWLGVYGPAEQSQGVTPTQQPPASQVPPLPTRPNTTPPAAQPTPETPSGGSSSTSVGDALNRPTQPTPTQVPRGMVSDNEAIRTAMAQMALNLMVPSWGGPLAQIGTAIGAGGEAVGRLQASQDERVQQGQEAESETLKNQALQALIKQRQESAETSRAKRVAGGTGKKSTTEFERLATDLGLGAKGRAIFKEGMKGFDEILNPLTPESFEELLTMAREADGPGSEEGTPAPAGADWPKVGDIIKGDDGNYRFNGGHPGKPSNYTKVE